MRKEIIIRLDKAYRMFTNQGRGSFRSPDFYLWSWSFHELLLYAELP